MPCSNMRGHVLQAIIGLDLMLETCDTRNLLASIMFRIVKTANRNSPTCKQQI